MVSSGEEEFSLFLKNLGQKPQTTLRFFDRGEYYTLHESDAVVTAKDYYNDLSVVKHSSKTRVPYITIKKNNVDFLRHFLLRRQYRIEIYSSGTKTGKDNDWSLRIKASPGDLSQIEETLLSNSNFIEASGLLSVNLTWKNDELSIHLAFCHKETRRFIVGEFLDSIQLANLETALVQLEARECLVPTGIISSTSTTDKRSEARPGIGAFFEHLGAIFERANILVTELKKKDYFLSSDVVQDLNYLLKQPCSSSLKTTELESSGSLACLGAIIKFLDLKADDSNASVFSIERFNLENCVRLDSAATRALHLLPSPDDKNKHHSVFGVLNHCRTAQGQRQLAQWLRQPLTDISKIDERLDLVEALVEESGVRQSLSDDFLRRVPDLQRSTRRIQRKKGAGLQDIYRIYQTISRLPHAVSLLTQCVGKQSAVVTGCLIDPLQDSITNFAKFQEMVESTLDLDAVRNFNEFIIRADFDDALGELKIKLDEFKESIEDEFRRAARKLNLEPGKSVKLETNEQLGYFMRVTLKDEKILREFKSFEILDTQKAGVRFRNPALSRLNESYIEAKQEYAEAQQNIVDEVLRIAAGYSEPLSNLDATISLLDVVTSLAVAAVSAPGMSYVRPRLLPRSSGRIKFKDARHPCLEMQESVSVIPNDVHLERGKHIFQIITGPNMGGKSTYIRAVGVIAAMAQIGSFVPCSDAELIPVDAIMARVGAADCQLRGVSTFLAEMLETSAVLRSATQNSLVIIDELGRGTSTYDGFGLAWSVASYLAGPQLGCFSLFATHFHELTSLANQMPDRVANLRVTASIQAPEPNGHDESSQRITSKTDQSNVVMLYKVEPGICNRSYGLDVARLAGLPDEIIQHAAARSARDERLESLWLSLDELSPKIFENSGNDDDSGPTKRFKPDPNETYPSHAVAISDRLRSHLCRIIEQCLESCALGDDFGHSVASATRDMISNRCLNLPSDLLLGLQLA